MVKISVNGFEFDDPEHHSTTLSKSSSPLTQNSKRFDISIDYSGGGNALGGNETQVLTITNNKCNAKDTIVANIMSNHPLLFLNPHGIGEGSFSLMIRNFGPPVSNTVDISFLVVT